MRRRISLRQIEGFLLACEHLSFSRASAEMHITQSAFSQLIQNLEHQLGVRLFDRTTRRMLLTAAGETMQCKLKRSLESIDEACDEAVAIGRVDRGNLRLGSISSLAIGIVTRTLEQLRTDCPGISVSLHEGYSNVLVELVVSGVVDLAVCCEVKSAHGLSFEHVFDDELVLVTRAGTPLAQRERVHWVDLAAESLVLTAPGTNSCEQVLAALELHGIVAPSRYDVASVPTSMTMVRAGFGSAFVSRVVLRDSDLTGLAAVRMSEPAVRRMGIYRRADRQQSHANKKFSELLQAQADAMCLRAPLAA